MGRFTAIPPWDCVRARRKLCAGREASAPSSGDQRLHEGQMGRRELHDGVITPAVTQGLSIDSLVEKVH